MLLGEWDYDCVHTPFYRASPCCRSSWVRWVHLIALLTLSTMIKQDTYKVKPLNSAQSSCGAPALVTPALKLWQEVSVADGLLSATQRAKADVCKVPWVEKHQQPQSIPCNGCPPPRVMRQRSLQESVGPVPSTIFTRIYNRDCLW